MEEKDVLVETSGGGVSTIVGCFSGCCSCSCEENDVEDVKTKEERKEERLAKEGYVRVNNDYYVKESVFELKTKKYLFEDGCVWEDFPMEINRNRVLSEYDRQCKHCVKIENGSKVIPWVVIGTNEAGWDTTGICLECAIEAMNKIKENEK